MVYSKWWLSEMFYNWLFLMKAVLLSNTCALVYFFPKLSITRTAQDFFNCNHRTLLRSKPQHSHQAMLHSLHWIWWKMNTPLDPQIHRWLPAGRVPKCKWSMIYDTPQKLHQLLVFIMLPNWSAWGTCLTKGMHWKAHKKSCVLLLRHNFCFLQV